MERNSKLSHQYVSSSPPKKPGRRLSILFIPFVADDATVYSADMMSRNLIESMTSFTDGNEDEWLQRASNSSINGAQATLTSNLLESQFPCFSPELNVQNTLSKQLAEQRTISALSFTFSELEGMGSSWAAKQKNANKMVRTTAAIVDRKNNFVEALYSPDRRNVSVLFNDVVACKAHRRDISSLSFTLDYDTDESDDSLTF
jgi:hypothetical protein